MASQSAGGRRRTVTARLLGCLLLALPLVAGAWDGPPPTPATARFRSLTDVDGLSQMTALALAQDRDGLLWVGTQVGLNRYDGARFRTFDRWRHPAGPSSQHDVSALLEDRDGALWVGTLNGLYRFDPAVEEVGPLRLATGVIAALEHQRINALAVDRSGALWIASDGGLSRYDVAHADLRSFETTVDGIAQRVLAIAVAGPDTLWVGRTDGLWRFTPADGRFVPLDMPAAAAPTACRARSSQSCAGPPPDALRGWIQALRLSTDGRLWIGSKDAGLLRLDAANDVLEQWQHDPGDARSLSHNRVYALLEDRAGRLWIGTEAGADLLVPVEDGPARFARFQHRAAQPGSIGAGRVVSLLEDRAGDLWFGTWSGGASLLSPVRSRFHSFSVDALDPQAVDAAEVVSITEAGGEAVWLGTRRGLYHFDAATDTLEAVSATAGLRVYAVARDGPTLLLGSDQGLHRFDPRNVRLTRVEVPPAVGTPYVDFIIVESARVWVSTRDADLFVLDRSMTRLLKHHRLDSRAHFMERFDGELKILGGDRGLYWFTPEGLQVAHRLRAMPEDPGALQSDTCHHYLRGRDGRRWLATAAGLHLMVLPDGAAPSAARFEIWRNGSSASANAIKSLLEDPRGQLWMGSNAGITRLDPQRRRFTAFGAADGAIDRGYYAFVHARTASGRIAFGGASGFTVFDPLLVADLPPPPAPLLTALEVDHRPVQFDALAAAPLLTRPLHLSAQLTLPAGVGRTLGLKFASPYFVAPEHLRFAYRLEGFNEDWVETDGRAGLANYTNLAPGAYRFRMRARTADADFGEAEGMLTIRIEPFWWQTRWAQALGLLGLVALISGLFFGRLRLLARQRQRLGEQVARATAQSDDALAQMHSAHRALAEAYARIDQLSRTDPLTGVGNRRLLDQRLPDLLEQAGTSAGHGTRLAFLLLDIDRFKELNDQHGHAAGDAVLHAMGGLLHGALPEPALVVRWGGEEFLVVQPVADEDDALAGAERLRRAIAALQPAIADGRRVDVSASIGVACYPFDPQTPARVDWERVVQIADAALYAAKRNGRNRVCGWRCEGALSADFEQRLRGGPQALRAGAGVTLRCWPPDVAAPRPAAEGE